MVSTIRPLMASRIGARGSRMHNMIKLMFLRVAFRSPRSVGIHGMQPFPTTRAPADPNTIKLQLFGLFAQQPL